ncbi:histidine kinase [Flavobacteriaceae bacterium F08102]|nr:histidine kinase [Flavobacteriaceae bacterium F08102]
MHKNKKISILLHILIWLVLFSMPYVLSYGQSQEINRIIAHFWIPLAFYAIIFYVNYFVLVDRLLFTKKIVFYVLINIAMIVLFVTLKEQIESHFFSDLLRRKAKDNDTGPPFKMFLYIQMLSYLAPLLFSIALKSTKRWIRIEAERKELANIKLQAELQHLHYQLQPHFFFNSLNNIYALVDISPDQAKSSIHSLSKLMRYMLYDTNMELVPLSKEIDFMEKYIDLMKLRVSDKTVVKVHFPVEETGIQIAPLLFISLIENAFKHGVSASKPSQIEISMTISNTTVLFAIKNNCFPKKSDDKSGSGIGIKNLEKRLQLVYPGKHDFKTTLKNSQFLVHLAIETT